MRIDNKKTIRSLPAIGALTRSISIPTTLPTFLAPPAGNDSLVPSPSLPIEKDPADRQQFQRQEEQTSETQLTAEQEQRQQQLTVDEILKDPTGQAAD